MNILFKTPYFFLHFLYSTLVFSFYFDLVKYIFVVYYRYKKGRFDNDNHWCQIKFLG